jgi:hypothetical protein
MIRTFKLKGKVNDDLKTNFIDEQNKQFEAVLEKLPNDCPFCNKSVSPQVFSGFKKENKIRVLFRCPNTICKEVFIGRYIDVNLTQNSLKVYKYIDVVPINNKQYVASESIAKISPSFVEIYNQSLISEQHKLNHIFGMGLRKALEFLIKDYLIFSIPDKENEIKQKSLSNCIKNHITDQNLKIVAEKAAWLGNDETHYERIWVDKDIKDLKTLIELTMYWIEAEILTKKYKVNMEKNK